MRIQLGCEMIYQFAAPTPMIAMLNVHHSRFSSLEGPDHLITSPMVNLSSYRDSFGNWCNRMVAPAGTFTLGTNAILHDDGGYDPVGLDARQHPVEELPSEVLQYLLGSRYCETDLLSEIAWQRFQGTPPGWPRVQAICDFVNQHLTFGYEHSRPTRTASEAYHEGVGVCRDYTHLAITLCRCMNLPARYCTGYISDIGKPPPYADMDFAAWMEVYLGGRWWTFDPRNNAPCIGRVLIAQGRDATDVPLTHTFGPNTLGGFSVWIYELAPKA
ncbi:MAG: transglutaminase family protein [Salinicola sp.]|uniref:transglutaminase-like domain-containing protein n=1 Tax=Salinicola sp. TaxID=1978524 RepID=UPI001DE506ED|nr:transglutaminase family protein [Salinicola sp.]NRB54424.1 transglutaminase family protein [Salinicola sp.]